MQDRTRTIENEGVSQQRSRRRRRQASSPNTNYGQVGGSFWTDVLKQHALSGVDWPDDPCAERMRRLSSAVLESTGREGMETGSAMSHQGLHQAQTSSIYSRRGRRSCFLDARRCHRCKVKEAATHRPGVRAWQAPHPCTPELSFSPLRHLRHRHCHRHRHPRRLLTFTRRHVCPRSQRSLAAHPDRAHATHTTIRWRRRRTTQGRFWWTRRHRLPRRRPVRRQQRALQR